MTIYQIGLLQVGFLCFIGLCIYALGKAVAPKCKPSSDWEAIADGLYREALRIADVTGAANREEPLAAYEKAKHD